MRAELMSLTAASLAELTNRGLVKRAARELERAAPELAEDASGTVRATFPDGVIASLPAGGLEAGSCSCGAPGVCRHLVGLVLAYQAAPATAAAGPEVVWSPGDFTDEQLAARIGQRMMTAARRVERTGYVARVRRGHPDDPVPSVELPTATVRFLVPGDLGYARTDAVAGTREDVLALAVWAFRAADQQSPGEDDVQVQVGGDSGDRPAGAGLDRAVAFAATVLREGAVHLGAGLHAEVTAARRDLDTARMRWPALALDDLVTQLDAYRERSARYAPGAVADHVAELFARQRAVARGGGSLASRVLGTDEASETALRRARLDGLGARVRAVGDERVVEVFLAHADSATVLVLRRAYEGDTGPDLAGRRVAGVTLAALATGAVITESASRSASRQVRLGARRLSRTEALAARGAWQDLPRSLIAADLAALAAELDALPPRPVRARIEAELVRVVPIAEVRSVSYSPGAQRLDAVIADRSGGLATITATHAACAPGRLDAIAAALGALDAPAAGSRAGSAEDASDGDGPVEGESGAGASSEAASGAGRTGLSEPGADVDGGMAAAGPLGEGQAAAGGMLFVSGMVRRGGGGVLIDPIGFATAEGVVAPDLAGADRGAGARDRPAGPGDALGQAVEDALALLAEIVHRGLLHTAPTMPERLRSTGRRLGAVGLRRSGDALTDLAGRLGPDPGDEAVIAWTDAYLRLSLTADLRS